MNKTADEFFNEAFFNEEEDTAYEGDDTLDDDFDFDPEEDYDDMNYPDDDEDDDNDDDAHEEHVHPHHHCHDKDDDYDISSFGMHGGPDVPDNQFNEQDVARLNFLISSESDAINDYFEATTKTSDPHLSKLYGDIGHEERFHLEQLMYAKSVITGEKYTPKDPDVRKEYEELINDGMDEDNAMYTALDKVAIVSATPQMNDAQAVITQQDIQMSEQFLLQQEILNDIIIEHCDFYKNKIEPAYCAYIEHYIMEDISNSATLPNSIKHAQSPIKFIITQVKNLMNFIFSIIHKVKDYLSRGRLRRSKIKQWVEKHGVSGIFEQGFSFYTYDDTKGQFDNSAFMKYADMLFRTSQIIANNCGFTLNVQNPIHRSAVQEPIQISNAQNGVDLIKGVILTKTKCIVNENNEDYIKAYLFGYTPSKMLRVYDETDPTGKTTLKREALSVNGYNQLLIDLDCIMKASKLCQEVATHLERMEGNPQSVYNENNKMYQISVKQIAEVMKGYTKLTKALNADLSTMLEIDNMIIQATTQHDKEGNNYKGSTFTMNDVNNKQQQAMTDPNTGTQHIVNNVSTYTGGPNVM